MRYFLFLTFIFIHFSCSKNNIPANEILNYGTSPIDLMGLNAKFASNINYDLKPRTQFDVFIPNSSTPTGIVIYIHGGGFISGEKEDVYQIKQGGLWDFPKDIRKLLQNNIAFATIRYSYIESNDTIGDLRSLNDIKRAIQYIRFKNTLFNIDKNKIILAGNSAGASAAMWLATHNDLQDLANSDPILKESSRVKAIAIREAQASLDIKKWQTDVFIDYIMPFSDIINIIDSNYLHNFYGIQTNSDFNSSKTIAYRNDIDFLNLISNDDPELWVDNTLRNVEIPTNTELVFHHAFHARELKERYDNLSLKSVFYYGNSPLIYSHPSNENWTSFAIRKINE